jgi:T5SS/PEP-CTERM-associated repeat protein
MKLPLKFLAKKEKTEYYLSLVLQHEKAVAVIFEKIGTTIKYISSDEESFKDNIEVATMEEFLDCLDKVITTAETALPENIETHKTIFGLKDDWIEDDKIKKEYLEKLKKVSDELALEPIGFLAFSESLINLIQKNEGAPLTAILASIGEKYATVYWIKGGKIIETKQSEIHESVSFTVDALMKHFQSGGSFPTKIILYNSDEEELTQEFIGHQWSKSLSFLHIPQIESLPKDATTKAVLLGASTQMGTQLIYEETKNIEENISQNKIRAIMPEEENEEDKTLLEEVQAETQTQPEQLESDNFEFVENEDIIEEKSPTEIEEVSSEFFGFVEGIDVTKTAPAKISIEENIPDEVKSETIEEIAEEVKLEEEIKNPLPINFGLVTEKIKIFLPKVFGLTEKIKINSEIFSFLKTKNKLLLIIPVVLILLILYVLYLYLFTTTVQINVFVNPKSEQKEESVIFSTNTDLANKTLSFETVTVSETGSTTTNATGKKYVGDKAKGTVTIFNNSNSTVTFSAGDTITSSNSLKYTLDKDISVASASGDVFSGTTPGTASTTVTASDIGQDYNLPSGTKFSIGSNSDLAAKNDNAFSGGTKKAITVVSVDDLNKLLSDLPKNLEQKAKDDLKTKQTSDNTIIVPFISETVSNKSFNKKENDEASNVTLNGTVEFDAISYLNKDMEDFANSLFSSDEKILSNNLTVTAKNIKQQKDQTINADLTINAKLMPKVNIDDLRKQIAGFSETKATNTLSNLPQTQSVNINFNPNIPLLPKNLPGDYKKIFINITSK